MTMMGCIRRFSTRRFFDKVSNVLQSSKDDRQMNLYRFIDNYIQKGDKISPNLINEVIQRWAIEQPTKEALWTGENNSNNCQKLTFNDIHTQVSRFANVLKGKEFNLTEGKSVLVILPADAPERILLQLACLQSGLIFCPYDPKDLTDSGIPQRIQKLAVDCIITNTDYFEFVRKYTHNPLRPLKKGLITTSEPLPVDWNHLLRAANDAESTYTKVTNMPINMPLIRFLSDHNTVIEYTQESFNLRLILIAIWFNLNRTSRLIWMKNPDEIISIAPWLFGSSVFHQATDNLFKTFSAHPIDTFCGSAVNYETIDNELHDNQTELKQLFSVEHVHPNIKSRWHSLTNLRIQDDYAKFNSKSILESLVNAVPQTSDHPNIQFELKHPNAYISISRTKFLPQLPIHQNQLFP